MMPRDDLEHLEDQREWVHRWKVLMDEAQSAIKIAKESDVELPIDFNIKHAEMQFGIWETRIRLSDRDKQEKEKWEKEAMQEGAASSPVPDDDVEMSSLLPPTLTKKQLIVESKPVTPSDLHDPPCDNCRRLRNNPGCSLLGKVKAGEVVVEEVGEGEDVDDDVTVANEPTIQTRSGKRGKGKGKGKEATVGLSSGMSEQQMHMLEVRMKAASAELWEIGKQVHQFCESSYPA
ncbi:hypothetical protein AZE42_07465 [Rhizopogon vesiculosus]|uniref:Uncharacterized protein n=2 Tax=Rhizopogon vesiculosus TaxID=180088 RepID=A0A1J8PEA5_9AGAM|nr:hypothetical protein AZE42_07465 [Rhizopogon vesiculosus]